MTTNSMITSDHTRNLNSLWVERLALTNFRNYASSRLRRREPQVIAGANGSGKTNMLEALSLLAPGQGMRRAPFNEIPRSGGDGGFAVAARVHTFNGAADIGTGLQPGAGRSSPWGRSQADRLREWRNHSAHLGEDRPHRAHRRRGADGLGCARGLSRNRLGDAGHGRAVHRCGFGAPPLSDRLILCFDPGYRTIAGRFERAMTARNRLLTRWRPR